MRRRTNGQPIGGALDCSVASSSANSGGSRSGTVASNCATFITGPLRPPSTVFSSSAALALSISRPSIRLTAVLAAKPPRLAVVLA